MNLFNITFLRENGQLEALSLFRTEDNSFSKPLYRGRKSLARSLRIFFARHGAWPLVDTAITRPLFSTNEGTIKLLSPGTSTTLTRIFFLRQAQETREFIERLFVAATTRKTPRRNSLPGTDFRQTIFPALLNFSRPAVSLGLYTITLARHFKRTLTFLSATVPPPTTQQILSFKSANNG